MSHPGFIVVELIAHLNDHKIVRPGYTTLQDLISGALSAERRRLSDHLADVLDDKELTQGTLIRKLCTYTQPNPTRRTIFEFDKLIHSIYTLRYLRDPQRQRYVHRSQNRLESYHQLRSVIAQVGGKKELTGRTDIEIEISNQCARLIANAIIYYNSAILSRAWRHLHLNGHYIFRSGWKAIDLDAIVAGLVLG
jgi:TnpA family transposase